MVSMVLLRTFFFSLYICVSLFFFVIIILTLCFHSSFRYVYTSDVSRSIRVPRSLHYGMIGVNEGIISDARAPFGGVKQSGQGREGGFQSGLSEYLDEKYVCVGGVEI